MIHRWWLITFLINWLESEVNHNPLIKEGSFSSFNSWRERVRRGRIASKFLKHQEGNFYALMKIADNVNVFSWSDESPIDVKIDLGWEYQTEARRQFGSVFPEEVKRQIRTRGTQVGRTYTWKGKQDDADVNVIVRFWREAIDGEIVDGCRIVVKRHTDAPLYVESRRSHLYASATCPVRR